VADSGQHQLTSRLIVEGQRIFDVKDSQPQQAGVLFFHQHKNCAALALKHSAERVPVPDMRDPAKMDLRPKVGKVDGPFSAAVARFSITPPCPSQSHNFARTG